MQKAVIPIYKLGQHCLDEKIHPYFKLTSFDVKACTATEFMENHRHEYYEVIWLKNGKGIHHIDNQPYPYAGGVIFLLSPGQVHLITQNEKAEGYVLRFLPGIFENPKDADDYLLDSCLFDNIDAKPALGLNETQYAIFENVFSMITLELNTGEQGQEQILSSYLKILLTQIQRIKQEQLCAETRIANNGYEAFRKYKIAIEKNFRTLHTVQDYADQLHTQARNLNSLARKYAGRSAGELITDRILLEAKRHLHHQSLSMKEIAFALGFEDPAYFNRFFKKQVGVAPGQFTAAQ
jgi:AraC-like DNA-binding protein